jgi:hypothetical protein
MATLDKELTYFDDVPGFGKVFNMARFITARDNGELDYLEQDK